MSGDARPELRLSSHVLVQLGSELVTDVEQAILECVKNAYDADSFGCKITIDTRVEDVVTEVDLASRLSRFGEKADNVKARVIDLPSRQGEAPSVERRLEYKGSIEIKDFGDGLTEEQLRTSWLVISGSSKRAVSGEPKRKTHKNRTPLGDKGLGRLGTMRLGDILKVESATSPDGPLSTAWFRWADCKTAETIDQIPVRLETKENPEGFKGTKVTVLGLNDLPEWDKDDRLNQITRSMMRLISPFEATSKFMVTVALNGVEQSLAGLTENVLNRAVARYDFDWTTNSETGTPELRMRARFKRALFEPTRSGGMRERSAISFTPDEGAGYFGFLAGYGRMKRYEAPRVDRNGAWILEIRKAISWSQIMGKDKDKVAVVDPGPFTGSIYYFFLDNLGEDTSNISGNVAEPIDKDLIKSMAGVSILRDGFRVRSQGDWLGIAAGMTSGSTYQMRVTNTVGFFALTGEHNFRLTEKSDREGFVEDAAYRGFLQVANACKVFANDTLEDVRRGFDAYHKQQIENHPGEAPLTTKASFDVLDRTIDASRKARAKVDTISTTLRRHVDDLALVGSDPVAAQRLATKAVSATRDAIRAMDEVRDGLAPDLRSQDAVRRLQIAFEEGQEQLSALFESAAIGLSARGLAHELRAHLGEIRLRTAALERDAKKGGGDNEVLANVRAIRLACTEILKAAALIDPMLPRGRSVKEPINLLEFAKGYMSAREGLFGRLGIKGEVEESGRAATVMLNRARLNQVLDNLVRNSMYWLRNVSVDPQSDHPRREGIIIVEVSPYGFVVRDNGPGVDPGYEDSLFDIFVSGKPDREPGQGLGLFIVRSLLQSDGGDVSLLPERNAHGRRFKFSVTTPVTTEKSMPR